MNPIYIIAPILLASAFRVQASSWSMDELPGEVKGCMQSGTCVTFSNSTADFGNVSIFTYVTLNSFNNSYEFKNLVRYTLTSPSAKSTALASVYDPEFDQYSYTPLNGAIWLVAEDSYALSESQHTFTLYLDKVSPGADNLWAWDEHPWKKIISVSTSDLLAGQSHYVMDVLDNYTEEGSLTLHGTAGDAGYPYLSCIECSVGIQFNLIGLQYTSTGTTASLGVNTLDTRAMVYSEWSYQHEGSYTGSRSQQFYVAAIPEPSTWGMLLAGLVLVGFSARRHQTN